MDFFKMIQQMKDSSPLKDLSSNSPKETETEDLSKLKIVIEDRETIITLLKKELEEKDKIIVENNRKGNCETLIELKKLKEEIDKLKNDNESLEMKNQNLEERIKEINNLGGIQGLLRDYETILQNFLNRCLKLEEEKDLAGKHLACLEFAFSDLLEKYERAKTVIIQYQKNQEILLDEANKYKSSMMNLEEHNKSYILDTQKKIGEFIEQLSNRESSHIGEVTKLKAKILHSQMKITNLENKITTSEKNSTELSDDQT